MTTNIVAEVESEITGTANGFGLLSPDHVVILDELEMRRIGNRFGKKFGHVPVPFGASLTIVVKDEEE